MRLAAAVPLALAMLAGGCATGGGAGGSRAGVTAAPADSATVLLWRLDETTGARIADAGPLRVEGRAGVDTRPEFGRVRHGRLFTRSLDSFAYAEHRAALDPHRDITVEAWVSPAAWGSYELSPIASRWTQRAGEQSWLLGVTGYNTAPGFGAAPGPRYLQSMVSRAGPGYVVFAFEPRDAGVLRAFSSATPIPLGRFTHVAVTFDGEVVRFFLNGRQDAQYAASGRIRPSPAPLLIGNYFDWRSLTEFGGDLRVEQADRTPYYAFEGTLDEVRISNAARTAFPHARD